MSEDVEALAKERLMTANKLRLANEVARADRTRPNRRCDTVIEPAFFES